ncbi:MAG TPA: hypothetical protein VER33_16520, partial [Polyangiaceae bacterium]|nr:hypothetical protein [Polyangiaceae bacterium]
MTSFQHVVSLVALSLAACGGEATPEPASPPPAPLEATAAPTTPSVGASSLDQSGTGADASASSASSAAAAAPPAPAPLTDEQILMVSDLANTAEVDQARVAQGKAKDA